MSDDYQSFPDDDCLKKNMDAPLQRIFDLVGDRVGTCKVRAYILRTVELQGGKFAQWGSAPNWQGGMVTLCTCKHQMRTYHTIEQWQSQNIWVAGFSSLKETPDGRSLIYLMNVFQAFESHGDLWNSDLPQKTKTAKSAKKHILGDIYEPKRNLVGEEKFHPNNYEVHPEHIHYKGNSLYKQDIDYIGHQTKRHPSLLVGNPELSFIWTEPCYKLPSSERFREKVFTLQELLQLLIKAK